MINYIKIHLKKKPEFYKITTIIALILAVSIFQDHRIVYSYSQDAKNPFYDIFYLYYNNEMESAKKLLKYIFDNPKLKGQAHVNYGLIHEYNGNIKQAEKKLAVGALELNEETRRVAVHDQELELTPNEFGLLRVMLAHPNRVFPRSELLNLVQGYEFDGYDRTIDTHIKNLRKKIAALLPNKDIISSVHNSRSEP